MSLTIIYMESKKKKSSVWGFLIMLEPNKDLNNLLAFLSSVFPTAHYDFYLGYPPTLSTHSSSFNISRLQAWGHCVQEGRYLPSSCLKLSKLMSTMFHYVGCKPVLNFILCILFYIILPSFQDHLMLQYFILVIIIRNN